MKSEILAPAGSKESLTAAVNCGADAVYLGVGEFNARQNATNFDLETLSNTVGYCHARNVKVYVTLNTLVNDSEIKKVQKTIERITLSGADALILQDLGVAKIVREISPDIKMHASTQMSVQTLYGIDELEKLGFSRVVIPRELNKKEIEHIVKNSPLEVEMFVHGALCMCVSGQCQLSAMLGGRSGNRGLCAQPCRLPFSIDGGTGYDLSLKDLSLIEKLPELQNMGVTSFKIEGRMKRPEYVAGVVTACRESLEGKYTFERREDLRSLFSRNGFTDGYYEGSVNKDMFGFRSKEDVVAAYNVLAEYKSLYAKELKRIAVDFEFSAMLNEKAKLIARAGDKSAVFETEMVCEKAINAPLNEEKVTEQLDKCGSTPFYARSINVKIDNNISLPISGINALRRNALNSLLAEAEKTPKKRLIKKEYKFEQHKTSASPQIYARFDNLSQIPMHLDVDKVILPLSASPDVVEVFDAAVEIPRGIFGWDDKIFENLKKSPAKEAVCSTLDAVNMAKKAGKRVIASPYLNLFNSVSLSAAQEIGISEAAISCEATLKQIEYLGGKIKRGIAAYGRNTLMITRNCPIRHSSDCFKCRRGGFITDRKGVKFPVFCMSGCSTLYNSVPTYMADKLNDVKNVDFIALGFTNESKEEIMKIIDAYKKGLPSEKEFTRALFYRGVE